MNAVGKKKTDRRIKAKRRVSATRTMSLKKAVPPSAVESQIAAFEQTFTDRWEW